MMSAKEKIDALPVRELYEFRCSVEHLPREQQVTEAGRFLA